jgi:hypothetical protein
LGWLALTSRPAPWSTRTKWSTTVAVRLLHTPDLVLIPTQARTPTPDPTLDRDRIQALDLILVRTLVLAHNRTLILNRIRFIPSTTAAIIGRTGTTRTFRARSTIGTVWRCSR